MSREILLYIIYGFVRPNSRKKEQMNDVVRPYEWKSQHHFLSIKYQWHNPNLQEIHAG